jgi:hypothetical protein
MFAMPNPTRLLFCRLGIVVFCLLPTATVGGWIVQRTSGQFAIAQKAEWERELSSRLGLTVEIEAVSYPSHALASLKNVRLADPETGDWIASASQIEVAATESGWRVQAWQPQIAAGRLADLARLLEGRLLREAPASAPSCVVTASELLLVEGNDGHSLLNVLARLEYGPDGPSADVTFHLPAPSNSAAPARLLVARNRQTSPPTTFWQLDTAGNALPLAMLSAALPATNRLGPHCRFDGRIAIEDSAAGLSGDCSGTLHDVDLDSLVTEHFPHQLSGQARVKVERVTLDRGKLVELRGTMQAHDGAISHSLLSAAQEHLGLVLVTDNSSIQPGRATAYRQLSLGFALNDRAISLTGSADPTQPGILLANAAGPILQAPPQHAAPAVNLLRALLPDNQYQVPATRQTDALVRLLPVPDLAPAQTASRPASHVPTRLAPAAPQAAAPAIRQPTLR